jgi:hypothetical protein
MSIVGRASVVAAGIVAVAAAGAAAAEFPPVTAAERALTAVEFEPGAPAVVLFRKAVLRIQEYPRELSSTLEVAVRLKVLTEEGKAFGEVAIPHSRFYRLKGFEGRTVLPDGRVVPLPADAVFREERSRSAREYVTKAAFPAVEVGAILDYRYSTRWDSLFFLEPWLFNDVVPTLASEVAFVVPPNLSVKPWGREIGGAAMALVREDQARGTRVRVSMTDVPSVPEEPMSFPRIDLVNRFLLLPVEVFVGGEGIRLFETWQSTCGIYADSYVEFRRQDRQAKKRALELAAAVAKPRDKAAALFAFVRDEIRTVPALGVGVGEHGVDRVLADRRGDPAEKALLLAAMLEAVRIEPELVWAADRREGRVDLELATPWWFDRVLVAVTLDGARVFLDPADPDLGFGRLSPHYEGMPALLFDRKKPETIALPASPFEGNARRARLELAVAEDGRVGGAGTLELTGHHAWLRLDWRAGDRPSAERWKDWLGEAFAGFEVGEVTVAEAVEEARVTVAWSLGQRPEEALGDEVSLALARPLGPVSQPFTLDGAKRKTPVLVPFPDRDELEVTVTWPEGWAPELVPAPVAVRSAAGELVAAAETDGAARRLTYRRRLDLVARELVDSAGYEALRGLFAAAEKHDAETLVLVGP